MSALDELLSPAVETLWMQMNSATVYILQCRFEDAIDTLTEVFQAEAVLNAYQTTVVPETKQGKRIKLQVTPLPSVCHKQTDGSFLNPFSIDQHGILLVQDREDNNNDDRQHMLLGMCAVSLFNMAVTYHTMAFAQGRATNNEAAFVQYLRKARSVYLQANVLLQCVARLGPESSLMNLYMAICNNMAEIELQLGHKTDTWKDELANKFCTIPTRACCPVYQHFDRAVASYRDGGAITR
jgi:hypothetical protein